MPKFSIIVPVYNVEREYLEAALNSMLAQTFTDWECICVDDGSTNDSGKVLDEFAVKDSRFKVHHRTNQGVSAARNFALDNTNGEWITFLDGDDLFAPNKLAVLSTLSDKYNGCKVIRNRVAPFGEHEAWEANIADKPIDGVYDLSSFFPFGIVGVCEFSLHTSAIRSIRFQNFKNGEDGIFFFECIRTQSNYVFTSAALYGYRQRQSSFTHRQSAPVILDGFRSIIYRMKMFQEDGRTIYLFYSALVLTTICHDFITKTVHHIPMRYQKPLWDAWFDSLEFLASRKEFHLAYRLMFKICNITQSRLISYLLSGIGLAIAWRLRLPFAHPLSPKAWTAESDRIIELPDASASA